MARELVNYFRTGQIARRLHVSGVTVKRWAKAGRLPCVRLQGGEGHHRFLLEDLEPICSIPGFWHFAGETDQPLLSIRETARYLGVYSNALFDLIDRGVLVPVLITPGGQPLFFSSDLKCYKETNRFPEREPPRFLIERPEIAKPDEGEDKSPPPSIAEGFHRSIDKKIRSLMANGELDGAIELVRNIVEARALQLTGNKAGIAFTVSAKRNAINAVFTELSALFSIHHRDGRRLTLDPSVAPYVIELSNLILHMADTGFARSFDRFSYTSRDPRRV